MGIFSSDSGLSFITSEQRAEMIATKQQFFIRRVTFSEKVDQFGKRKWILDIAYVDDPHNREGLISFQESLAKDDLFRQLQTYLKNESPVYGPVYLKIGEAYKKGQNPPLLICDVENEEAPF